MKRECLLSKAYAAAPMKFNGTEIAYSPLVNELMRELENSIFSRGGDGSQTEQLALVECLLIMIWISNNEKSKVADYLNQPRKDRNRECVAFYLENEDEVERLKPEIISRLESAAASAVESESPGKPPEQRQASSPS